MKPKNRAATAAFELLETRTLFALIGLDIGFPATDFNVTGTVSYSAGSQTFNATGVPLLFQLTDVSVPVLVSGPRSLALNITVDNSGNLVGGVTGDDLVVTGTISALGLSGTLLTGEVLQFGFLDSGVTDQYDFRFVPTGGALLPYFQNQDIGLRISSANSNFSDFQSDFSGENHGIFGPTEMFNPGSLSGFVYVDFNDDGLIDMNEPGIPNTPLKLEGTDLFGNAILQTTTTDSTGMYLFDHLRAGTYKITETQPVGYLDGKDTVGTLGGNAALNDVFSSIPLQFGDNGINYNFGERTSGTVHQGDFATIGFWHNKNGQKLLNSLNGGSTATNLGNWLAATFPNLYGANAGANNLSGFTNSQVASFYINQKFNVKGQKVDAQVMAAAFGVYVTSSTLAGGNFGSSFGFNVSSAGVGGRLINVGANGAAFGVANNSTITVLQALLATNSLTSNNGILYDGNQALRNMANTVYTMINEQGDI